ncbi:MAG: peptidoglycan DD-metalloendopeptidase family protein [Pseudomonadota bacterium]
MLSNTVLLAGLALFTLASCSRSSPAPVEQLYTGKDYRDYQPNSLKNTARYTVKKGETLYTIAFRANLNVADLARINQLQEPYTIYPGQQLKLVDNVLQSQPTTSVAKTKTKTKRNKENSSSAEKNITVAVDKAPNKAYVQTKEPKKSVKKQSDQKNKSSAPKNIKAGRVASQAKPATMRDSKDIEWQWPVKGSVIADFSLAEPGNKGLDFAGRLGDPVAAAAGGKVVYVGNALRGFGRLIILKHNDDFITAYAHNHRVLVAEQQWVEAGQMIAEMGDSGTQRVKLHFEVRFRGKSVNPRHYLPKSR